MSDSRLVAVPFGGEEGASPFEGSRVAFLPVPYEGTVSYGRGASEGPAAILAASAQVELFDEQTGLEPFRAGIWSDSPLPIPEGGAERVASAVERRVGDLLDAGKWVVMLGGEHSITPGAVAAAVVRSPGLRVVQLDAHADLRDSYEGDRFSHASAMARCLDLAPVRAIGIRNYSIEEAERIRAGIPGYAILHAWEMEGEGWQERALDGLDGSPVYLTIDLDYFDPAVIPSTGTPEPGGGAWWPTVRFLDALFRRTRVIACDLVELAPAPALRHADFAAARLAYKLVGMRFPAESRAVFPRG